MHFWNNLSKCIDFKQSYSFSGMVFYAQSTNFWQLFQNHCSIGFPNCVQDSTFRFDVMLRDCYADAHASLPLAAEFTSEPGDTIMLTEAKMIVSFLAGQPLSTWWLKMCLSVYSDSVFHQLPVPLRPNSWIALLLFSLGFRLGFSSPWQSDHSSKWFVLVYNCLILEPEAAYYHDIHVSYEYIATFGPKC